MKLFKRSEAPEEAPEDEKTGETCDVVGCGNEAYRSISAKNVSKAGLKIKKDRGKAHLCREHYKEYKKATKKDRELERLGR